MSGADDLYRELGVEPDLADPGDDHPDELTTVAPAVLDGLGSHLVWKIGREETSGRIVVRVGYATATRSFADLPRLHGASDPELAEAARNGELVVEWIE